MGINYTGDIEGKFYRIQSSTAPERFGARQRDVISYGVDNDHLDEIKKELESIKKMLGNKLEILNKFFEENNGYNDQQLKKLGISTNDLSEYADYKLGEKIFNCVQENGYCQFEEEL
jgi:hypothetical protein